LLSWNQRGELGTLTEADQVASPPAPMGEALFCGLYANELLTRFLQRMDPHPGLFEHYRQLLAVLAGDGALQPALRLFEMHLLDAAGFGLQLEHEAGSGVAVEADAWYRYIPDSGPTRCEFDAQQADQLVSGAALLALKSGHIDDRYLHELKSLMRRSIRYHLGDRPLQSAELFR
jgi:DNA repair protein RecO (recombination protein O)